MTYPGGETYAAARIAPPNLILFRRGMSMLTQIRFRTPRAPRMPACFGLLVVLGACYQDLAGLATNLPLPAAIPLSGALSTEAEVPKAVEVSAEPSAVRITWRPPNGLSPDVVIERYHAGEWQAIGNAQAAAGEFLDQSIAPGESYCYRLRSIVDNSLLTPSKCVIVSKNSGVGLEAQAPAGGPIGRPEGLTAAATPEGLIELTWTDNCSNEEAYVVERTGGGEGWAPVVRLAPGATAHLDDTVTSGTGYCYRVAAVVGERLVYSKAVCARTGSALTPAPTDSTAAASGGPTGLAVENQANGGVRLSWTDEATDETACEVARYNAASGWQVIASLPPNSGTYMDPDVQPGQSYCWRVASVFANGSVRQTPPRCLRVSGPEAAPVRIRGVVRAQGTSLAGITIAVPDEDRTITTAADGSFEITVATGWSGRIVPRHWLYVFTPSELTFTHLLADIDGQDFEARPWSGGATPAEPGSKLLFPWLELTDRSLIAEDLWGSVEGSEGRVTYGEYCIRGLHYWARVTDVAILTTHPGGLAGTFEYVMANKPAGMRIIGGISTYTLPGGTPKDTRPYDFADTAGWQFIAAEAEYIAGVTGSNIVVLENELALTPFHRDGKLIDLEKLERSLSALRSTGIEFWWYLPSVQENTSRFPDRQNESVRLINTIAGALPDCRFIVGYAGYIDWRNNTRTEVTRREIMIGLVGQTRIVDYMFVTPDGYWYWSDGSRRYCHTAQDAFAEIRGLTGAPWACVYPGGGNWVTVARKFAEGYVPGP